MSFHRIKPILFNTEMVRAILDGRKTVTRRMIKPSQMQGIAPDRCPNHTPEEFVKEKSLLFEPYCDMTDEDMIKSIFKAPYQVGDILYVRETWNRGIVDSSDIEGDNSVWFEECNETEGYCAAISHYIYRADFTPKDEIEYGIEHWKPSIHMPKEAARIWLKVTDVRVERLQDITEDDVCKEGAEPLIQCAREHKTYNADGTLGDMCWNTDECSYCPFIEKSYSELFGKMVWNSTIKKQDLDQYGWDANPWVWVIEFERIER